MDCGGGVFIILCEASERPAVSCSDWLDVGGATKSSRLTSTSLTSRAHNANDHEKHTRPKCEERENAETNWIWVGIAGEAKLRRKNDDEKRPRTNAKKQQSDPEKTRHARIGGSVCNFAHEGKHI